MFPFIFANCGFYAQHYEGDVSELELYFVIVTNEYGEQREEELLPGGKEKRVTNDNVIQFIHLISNHRLNYQVQSSIASFFSAPVTKAYMFKVFASFPSTDSPSKFTFFAGV